MPWMNFWLLVLLILGTVIVATDGFSRDPMPDEGTAAPTPVLEYELFLGRVRFCLGLAPVMLLVRKKNWCFARGVDSAVVRS